MLKNIRVLPLTLVALLLIFGLKIGAVWTDAQGLLFNMSIQEAQATEQKAETEEEAPVEEKVASEDVVAEAKPPVKDLSMPPPPQFTKSEIEVLERLVERRSELDRRNQEIDMRDNLLKATEARIDEKISQLKEMEETLNKLLQLHDEQKVAQLDSIVKIYEKMKPKDAARIFNSLEMEILINVASKIKESKMAPILAAMNSQRANKLTVELATQRQLPGRDSKKS
ncbi:MAG: hypothetical protein COB93_03540 [Sneathiella sp.]|nr:MAG: hypothetical protein COB93_03540 [Sneathiella sp.]